MLKRLSVSDFAALSRGPYPVETLSPTGSVAATGKLLFDMTREDFSKDTFYGGFTKILKLLAATRIFLFPREMRKYHCLRVADKFAETARVRDFLYFVRHKFHLSKKFSLRQRVRCAIDHHDYEARRFSRDYLAQIYRGDGIVLWERVCDGHSFQMTLAATEDNRHEGELSLLLTADGVRLSRLSFSFVNADIVGGGCQDTLMITRNQADRPPQKKLFDLHFKQNSPQLFCLAALGGLAAANGFADVLAIRHDAQIAYEAIYDTGFRNSYSSLWEKFGAIEVDPNVYRLPLPLETKPLDEVSASHRNRARQRRAYWDEIGENARLTLGRYRVA